MTTDLESDLRGEFDASKPPSGLTFHPDSVLRQGNRTIRRRRIAAAGSAALAVALIAGGASLLTQPRDKALLQPLPANHGATATPGPSTSPAMTTAPTPTATATTSTAPTAGLPGTPACQLGVPGTNVPGLRPALIFIGCATSANNLQHISWSSWTTTGATGTATHGINDCKPSCAQGTYTYFPVNVRLDNPGRLNGMLVFKTIVMSPTSRVGRLETVTEHDPPYGIWGWSCSSAASLCSPG